jgi:NAD(P)H dehydrogenase (quinone)
VGPIAVTGSTGHVGSRVARRLEAAGVAQRLLVRDAGRAPAIADSEVVVAPYADTLACRAALEGCRTLFMVSASESAIRLQEHLAFVDAAVAAGVEHVVYTSFYGAAEDATFTLARDHWRTENHIRDSGIAFTFLRDNLYADVLPFFVGEDGALRGPAGDGAVSAVTRDDVADVAAVLLQEPDHCMGRTLDLTGPRAMTLDEVAEILTQRTGRAVTYVRETIEEARESRARWNPQPWQLDAWVSTYTAIAAGEMAGVSEDVERVTGHPATPLERMPLG